MPYPPCCKLEQLARGLDDSRQHYDRLRARLEEIGLGDEPIAHLTRQVVRSLDALITEARRQARRIQEGVPDPEEDAPRFYAARGFRRGGRQRR